MENRRRNPNTAEIIDEQTVKVARGLVKGLFKLVGGTSEILKASLRTVDVAAFRIGSDCYFKHWCGHWCGRCGQQCYFF